MLFNSYPFLFVFLPISLAVFFIFARLRLTRAATAWLVLASLVFYGYWNVAYLPLLVISILVNFSFGKLITRYRGTTRAAKSLLLSGVVFDLALLGYYKYANFFVGILNGLFHTSWVVGAVVLPLGISFFTFTQIAYLVDAYRGETGENDLLTYSLFVSIFPHLIAGPILHHKNIIPQLTRLRTFVFSHKNVAYGVTLFTLGLFKKVMIADSLSPWVSRMFDSAGSVSFIEAWAGALSYTFQLYFDFSGYSDMAIGLGLLFNVKLPINFHSPYKAASIIDFWRRWHITLSAFLKDYVYIPLGGNRRGEARRNVNLLSTMLLCGLWHGAGWTFVFWGGFHGVSMAINHLWRKLKITLPKPIAWALTFLTVVVGWVFFRARDFHDGIAIVKTMSGYNGIILPSKYLASLYWLKGFGVHFSTLGYLPFLYNDVEVLVTMSVLLLGVIFLPNTQQIMLRFKPRWWWALITCVLAAVAMIGMSHTSEFLYFQF